MKKKSGLIKSLTTMIDWLGYNKQFMSKTVLKNIDSIMGCV